MQPSFLRIVSPDGDGEQARGQRTPAHLPPNPTLRQFYEAYVWPEVKAPAGDSPRTRRADLEALAYWERHTGDPPLAAITRRTCSLFVRRHLADGLSPTTVRKHALALQMLLDLAGPRTRNNSDGADLLAEAPVVKPPRPHRPGPRPAYTLAELWEWLKLARRAPATDMTAPVEAAAWWPAAILLGYNTGQRPEALFGATWEMIAGRTLQLPPAIVKCRRGLSIYLNTAAVEALETLPHRTGPLLPWRGWPASHGTMYRQLQKLQRAAGVRELGFGGLRRLFATAAGSINPLAAQLTLNHAGLGFQMMQAHYLDRDALLREALEQLPQPGPMRQKTLF